jgi:hypothetical protein
MREARPLQAINLVQMSGWLVYKRNIMLSFKQKYLLLSFPNSQMNISFLLSLT